MRVRRALAAAAWLSLASSAVLATHSERDALPFAAPRAATSAELAGRMRVFATPGDYALANADVTAIVRRRDGWLTELFPAGARLPTAPGLGTTTDIDGLWDVVPAVVAGGAVRSVIASRVSKLADAIETEGELELNGVHYRARTTFRVPAAGARVVLETAWSVDGEVASGDVGLADPVRWGNVTYVVDGLPRPRMKYAGPARFIGRHGACGDLVLRTLDDAPMWVEYGAAFRGAAGRISALYQRGPIAPGQTLTVRREFSYEALPASVPVDDSGWGRLLVTVADEHGQPLPAKVRLDRAGSDEPLFDDDGDLDGVDRFLWTGDGRVERALPPGDYAVFVSAGFERDAKRSHVRIRGGRTASVSATLARVIATPGWIAADLHLHQAPSVEADTGLAERVVSVAAEGVELAVATDHYVVTDLAPTVAWLRDRGALRAKLATLSGSEVSTLGQRFGHFNVFPLPLDDNVVYRDTTPSALFADARRASPDGVLQVNHPRMDPAISYFAAYDVDLTSGEPQQAGYDPDFDALEVYNGDEARDLSKVRVVFRDWLHQLGRGRRYTGTGNSDSHKLAFLDPGLPRTMIAYGAGTDDAADVDAPMADVIVALKAGRAMVTSGPFIDASVEGQGPGQTARGVAHSARLHVVVRAAPWVDVSAVEIFVGGSGEHWRWLAVPRSKQVLRLDRTFDVPIEGKTFVVVTAEGSRGLPSASIPGTLPFAFTNPIWLEP